jgi:hypothetical protein
MVDGDDIMVKMAEDDIKKASVSITYCDNGVTLGHTGINVVAGPKAPKFAYSTNLSEENIAAFIKDVVNYFMWLTRDMFVATSKISVPK